MIKGLQIAKYAGRRSCRLPRAELSHQCDIMLAFFPLHHPPHTPPPQHWFYPPEAPLQLGYWQAISPRQMFILQWRFTYSLHATCWVENTWCCPLMPIWSLISGFNTLVRLLNWFVIMNCRTCGHITRKCQRSKLKSMSLWCITVQHLSSGI